MALREGEVLKASNGNVGEGEDGGVGGGAGEDAARMKGKKIVAVVVMASSVKDDAAEGT